MIEVELPDGTIGEFPDGTPDDVIKGVLQKQFGAPQSPQMDQGLQELSALTQNADPTVKARSDFQEMSPLRQLATSTADAVNLGMNGATMGFGNKIAAGMRAPFTDKTYAEELEIMRDQDQDARNRQGRGGAIAEIGGSVLGAGKILGAGASFTKLAPQTGSKLANILGMGAASSADALALNTLTNAGNDRDLGDNAGVAMIAGGAAPALGQVVSGGLNKVLGAFNKKPVIPSYDDIASQASQKYQAADAEGVIYAPQALQKMLADVEGDFASRTFEPLAQPGASTAIQLLQKRIGSGQPMTAEGLKAIRSIAGEQFMPGKTSNNALLNIMKSRIDDFSMDGNPANVITGNAPKAAGLRKEADALYSQKKKIETVRKALEQAESRAARTGSGGNLENTVKQELAKIRNNPKKGRGFTPDENKMIDDVIFNQTGRDALRVMGKLNPFRHGGAAAIGAGGMMVEPITAGALMTGGVLAKALGNAIQKGKTNQIERLIASGGKASALQVPKNAAQKALSASQEKIMRALMMSGVLAGSQAGQP